MRESRVNEAKLGGGIVLMAVDLRRVIEIDDEKCREKPWIQKK